MKMWRILTLTVTVIAVVAPLLAGVTARLPQAWRQGVVVLASPVAAAFVLVAYFTWRGRLRNQIVDAGRREDALARAA